MDKRDQLIFWFDQPPHVSKGAFNYVSEQWGNEVLFIADHEFPEHRKMIGWDDGNYGGAEMIFLSRQENPEQYVKSVFEKYPNAIHVLNGFFSAIEGKISPYVKRKGVKLIVHSEKPFITRKARSVKQFIKNVLLPIKAKKSYREYKNYVKALIPLGARGAEIFQNAGWEKEKVFSFMYCPILSELSVGDISVSTPIKFLYVGRFDKKRMLLLKSAIEKIKDKNYKLDMVGGYGNYAKEMQRWIDTQENVSFLGRWDASEVGKNMQNYDVYLLPTKCDGWNAQINEVINAGMGAIVTDEAISDELVSAANAGVVVSATSSKAFAKAIKTAVDNPETVKKWKENAVSYRDKIKGNVVGEYLMDILDYVFYGKREKPICPWL